MNDLESQENHNLDLKFKLLEKLINVFKEAKKAGGVNLNSWAGRVKKEILIGSIGQTEAVADQYIKAAIKRVESC